MSNGTSRLDQSLESSKSLRFGGISPTVLRELSGVYQPFVKAVKEIVSNSYDADATSVELRFSDDFDELEIHDNGLGMDPYEFIQKYLRIGKSTVSSAELTPRYNRPRIGGKGIGFLAPARYCEKLLIRTKKGEKSRGYITVQVNKNEHLDLSKILLDGFQDEEILKFINIEKITDNNDLDVSVKYSGLLLENSTAETQLKVWYTFDSRTFELDAEIDFNLLFSLDSSTSLEEIQNFCKVRIAKVEEDQKNNSYTKLTLVGINNTTKADLLKSGKPLAKNVESRDGIFQFLWNLSRIIPVQPKVSDNLPQELKEFITDELDYYRTEVGESTFSVQCHYPVHKRDKSTGDIVVIHKTEPLLRYVVEPKYTMSDIEDRDLYYIINENNNDYCIKGFLIGQQSVIYPAESRGILLRVKGVAVGESQFFGLDKVLSGATKAALSYISGEINILSGIDAITDINPGREGFYKESPTYNMIKKWLIGEDPEKPAGLLRDIIDAVVTRSETNASLNNFKKKYEGHRQAIVEAGALINEEFFMDPFIIDNFAVDKDNYELLLQPAVSYKAEGKLSNFIVKLVDNIEGEYKVDYYNKELLLNKSADIWQRNVYIGGINYEVVFKQGKKATIFCEVHSSLKRIYINWDHPLRSKLGDTAYIKHCLAVITAGIDQDKLNLYTKIVTTNL